MYPQKRNLYDNNLVTYFTLSATTETINMHLFQLFASLALATITTALLPNMPDTAVDGFYKAHVNDAGKSIHTHIAAPNNTGFIEGVAPRMTASKIAKRSIVYTWCGCGYNMNHGDCDAANADLANQVVRGVGVGGGTCYYSIRGSAVAFICNPYPNDQAGPIWSNNIGGSSAVITSQCGLYVAGTYAWGYRTSYEVGYMQYQAGLNFAVAAEGSSVTNC